jgi:hypothetical protein
MVTVTKKHQTSMALIAVVLATVMIAGTLAMGNNAFATRGGGHSGGHSFGNDGKTATSSQSISESCDQNQKAPVTTAGAISPPIASGINVGACLNLNLGGNALDQDQSFQK